MKLYQRALHSSDGGFMHEQPSKYAGKMVRIKPEVKHFQVPSFGRSEFRVEDWWDRVSGRSWREANWNPAAAVYGFRAGMAALPKDDEVLYGKVGSYGHLVHISEIEGE
jgi:hypothetical protein